VNEVKEFFYMLPVPAVGKWKENFRFSLTGRLSIHFFFYILKVHFRPFFLSPFNMCENDNWGRTSSESLGHNSTTFSLKVLRAAQLEAARQSKSIRIETENVH